MLIASFLAMFISTCLSQLESCLGASSSQASEMTTTFELSSFGNPLTGFRLSENRINFFIKKVYTTTNIVKKS